MDCDRLRVRLSLSQSAAIRHRVPTMPILVVTAFNDLTVIQGAREWRVPVIGKPFRLETLKAAVIQALAATRSFSTLRGLPVVFEAIEQVGTEE